VEWNQLWEKAATDEDSKIWEEGGTVPLILACKGKAIPLQAWTGPKGARRLRLPDI